MPRPARVPKAAQLGTSLKSSSLASPNTPICSLVPHIGPLFPAEHPRPPGEPLQPASPSGPSLHSFFRGHPLQQWGDARSRSSLLSVGRGLKCVSEWRGVDRVN